MDLNKIDISALEAVILNETLPTALRLDAVAMFLARTEDLHPGSDQSQANMGLLAAAD